MSRRAPLSRLEFFGDLSLSNALDWVVTLLLSVLLAAATMQLGGDRAETRMILLWLTGALLIFHALWMLSLGKDRKRAVSMYALAFLPFVAYVCLSWLMLSPTGWTARGEALLVLQGFAIFWVAVHNLGTRNHIWFLFLVLGALGFLSVLMAYNQYFRDPEWLPKLFNPLELKKYPVSAHAQYAGRASGPFGSPNSLAGFMILAFFPAALAALTKNLSPILRVFSGYLALMFVSGLVLSISRGGLLAFSLCLLLLPWFCGFKKKYAAIWTGLLILAAGVTVALLLVFSTRFQARWENFAGEGGERTRPEMWQAAWDVFLEHPVFGSGLGSYRYFLDQYRPEGFTAEPYHVHNDYLEVASDLGVVGVLLFFGVLGWLAILTWRAWLAMPDRVALDEVLRNRRRRRVMPHQKLFLSAVMLSLLAFGMHLFIEFHLHIPALLFWAAVFVAIAIKMLPPRAWKLETRLGWLGYAVALIVIGLLLPIGFTRSYVAEMYAFEGNRLTDEFSGDFGTLRADREFHEKRVRVLQGAVELYPDHAEAQSLLALALADQSYIDPARRLELGREAETHAREAVEMFEESPYFQIRLGETLFLQERWAEAGEAYERAVELAPNNDVVWYYYANWLNGEPGRRAEALAAIERSLELDPDDPQAQSLRRKILIP